MMQKMASVSLWIGFTSQALKLNWLYLGEALKLNWLDLGEALKLNWLD